MTLTQVPRRSTYVHTSPPAASLSRRSPRQFRIAPQQSRALVLGEPPCDAAKKSRMSATVLARAAVLARATFATRLNKRDP